MSGIKVTDVVSSIKSMLPISTEQRILNNKLGSDERGVPYYLYLLNLNFGEDDKEREISLNKFKQLAFDLRRKSKSIKTLIVSANWRPTLVGNAIAILLRAKEFQKDLVWRLENGNWVAPQIGVGIALLNDGFAENELERILKNATEASNPKTIMSAFSSLKFLEHKFADEFEKTKLFNFLKEKDSWDNSTKIAEEHWNFWKNIKPII